MEITKRKFHSKFKRDDGLYADNDVKNTLPSHLEVFILSNSKINMKNFIREGNDFYKNSISYEDRDSLYIENKYWDVLDKAGLVVGNLCHCRNE